ncbi:heparanase-like isoform X1 [Haliotis rufescens]|uniref:heparanase-like isoform X1 n=1 Tax=Haliotis rufescens TaxID=6454 RepID=UPI00201E7C20|nr:heparanase-like isoform X1 [Haliotis rufescens]
MVQVLGPIRFLVLLWIPTFTASQQHQVHVTVSTDSVVHEVDDMFVGVTIDSYILRAGFERHHLSSPNLQKLVKELVPSYLRVGGTSADHVVFDPHATQHSSNAASPFKLLAEDWDILNKFVHNTGVKLIFDLNILLRKQGKWDPSNAELLLKYSSQKGYHIAGFELGNEPNVFHHNANITLSDAQLANDFAQLKRVLQGTSYKSSLIVGPDVTVTHASGVKGFLSHGGASAVDVVSFHHYYVNGETSKVSDFSHPATLDSLVGLVKSAIAAVHAVAPGKPVWLGETASAYKGGTPNASDRYASGFLWLDKLGVSARYGIKGVLRQVLLGGKNGLISSSNDPLPDFWLTVLYKRLVGNKVFDVHSSTKNLRIYAHCIKHTNMYNYKPGSVTVYVLNVNTASAQLHFPHLHSQHHMDVFWLTPDWGNVEAGKVHLNGKLLTFVNSQIPQLSPKTVTTGSVTAPGKSFGFIVMPDANVAACKSQSHGPIIG